MVSSRLFRRCSISRKKEFAEVKLSGVEDCSDLGSSELSAAVTILERRGEHNVTGGSTSRNGPRLHPIDDQAVAFCGHALQEICVSH
jgi:hypothetical protein